jgi:hypothetical protein
MTTVSLRLFAALGGAFATLSLIACANDPVYIPGPMVIEAGMADDMGQPTPGKASVQLPIKTETASDKAKRDALAEKLTPIEVPYVRVGDLEIEVEYTIKNPDTKDGKAIVELNGANEYFAYDPSTIQLAPDDEDAPPTPGLAGDIPINVPAGGEVSGILTEDKVREAAIDLDEITRGNFNPFRATLTISKNAQEFQPVTALMPGVENYMQEPDGPAIPREAFAGLTRIDIVFKPDRQMTMEYNIRIRDQRGIVHKLLLTAETDKPDELQTFAPADFTVDVSTPTP